MSNSDGFNREMERKKDEEREWRVEAVTEETFKEIFKSMVPKEPEEVELEASSEEQEEDNVEEEGIEVFFPPFFKPVEPLTGFDTDVLHPSIKKALKMMNLSQPTTIQKHSTLFFRSDLNSNRRM
jgi:hypothetical protein